MRNRIARLALVAGLAVAVSAPLTQSASAGVCNTRDFPEVCAAIEAVCHTTAATRELCGQFG